MRELAGQLFGLELILQKCMNKRCAAHASFWLVFVALLCAAGMWSYAYRVLIPYQRADAAAHGRPRGNLSDLYPRWLGARELLLRGRDPYSAEVTREIQDGFYGRPLDASRPDDPKDQESFAYPVYVAFYLAPTIRLPFESVRKCFFGLLAGLTIASVLLWLRILRWTLPLSATVSVLALTFGTMVVLQALKLQQMTLLVAALLALAIFLLMTKHEFGAGFVLALATIKPQVVCGLLLWLALWTTGDVRRRYRWVVSFLVTMAVLCGMAELWRPHWIPRFFQAIQEYRIYASTEPIFDKLLPSPWSRLAEVGTGVAAAFVCWKNRKVTADSEAFVVTTCLMLAATLLIVPTYALYNQVLLLPALLLLARDRHALWRRTLDVRVLLILVVIQQSWQWVSGIVLAGLSFVLPAAVVWKAWTIPIWTALGLPVAVVGLMLALAYRGSLARSAERI